MGKSKALAKREEEFEQLLMASFKEVRLLKARRFLRCFARLGTIMEAAKAAHVSPGNHANWRKDPAYLAAFDLANEFVTDELERIAKDRAKKHSDLLMIFILKARKPEMYREQRVIVGDPSNPVKHEMRINLVRTEPDNRENYYPALPALGPGTDSD